MFPGQQTTRQWQCAAYGAALENHLAGTAGTRYHGVNNKGHFTYVTAATQATIVASTLPGVLQGADCHL